MTSPRSWPPSGGPRLSADPDGATLLDWLHAAAADDTYGLRFVDRREAERFLPWSRLTEQATRVAGGLAAAGLEPGARVGLVYPTGEPFFAAFFGTLLAGGVPTPLYPPVRLGRLEEYHRRTAALLEAAGVALLLAPGGLLALLGETLALHRPPLGARRLEGLPSGPPPVHRAAPDDLALVQFSSGTTVEPKPVALSHRAVTSQARTLNSFWPATSDVEPSGLSWLPLYHDMGLVGCVFPALERPAQLTLLPPEAFVARPALWLRALSRHRATVSPAPNFGYGLCLKRIADQELDGVDLSAWRVALNGAESVAPETVDAFTERFRRWGFRPAAMTPVYGLAEAALAVTFSDLGAPPRIVAFSRPALGRGRAEAAAGGRRIVSVGRPLPGFAVELRDDDGDPLPAGRVGRLWVRGSSLMEGYLGRPEATAQVLVDGWLDTGDLGFLHDGELFLVGRAKDVILVRGQNLAPEEVERLASGVAGVRQGCVVAASWLPEGAPEERLLVLAETATGTGQPAEGIADGIREAVLAGLGVSVDEVVALPPGTLPRTSSGKLRRGEALERHRTRRLGPPASVTPLRMAAAFGRSAAGWVRSRWRGTGG